MTREKAFKNRPIITSMKEANIIDDFIQEIYDDFENQTCKNCIKFNTFLDSCSIGITIPTKYDGYPDMTFGCNLWELKE